jgi:hypothetical protein
MKHGQTQKKLIAQFVTCYIPYSTFSLTGLLRLRTKMLPACVASTTLQKALLAQFQTFAGNGCNYYKRGFLLFFQDTLQQVTLQITSDSECNNTYYGGMSDRMMCAGDPNGVKGESVVRGS